MLVFLVVLLGACAPANSCAEYVAAARTCIEEAGGDAAAYEEGGVCGEWTSAQEDVYGAWYRCQAEAWESADCADTDGVSAAVVAANACPAG